jgi:8-oxo-dGTP diphosphatase
MEVGESLAETAIRETREETGLEVVTEKAVGVYSRPHPYYAELGWHLVGFVFLCCVVRGDLRMSDETTEFGYFDPTALPSDVVPTHLERIADAVAVRDGAEFRAK